MASPDLKQSSPDLEERQKVEYVRGVIAGILNGETTASFDLEDLPLPEDFKTGLWAHRQITRTPLEAEMARKGDMLSMHIKSQDGIEYGFVLEKDKLDSFGTELDFSKIRRPATIPFVHGNVLEFARELADFVARSRKLAHSS